MPLTQCRYLEAQNLQVPQEKYHHIQRSVLSEQEPSGNKLLVITTYIFTGEPDHENTNAENSNHIKTK